MPMTVGYLEVVEVKKIRSRNVCQLIVEADISQFRNLVALDEVKGVFIPCDISGAVCGAMEMDVEAEEIQELMGLTAKATPPPIEHDPPPKAKRGETLAQRMMTHGYFRQEKLWDAMDRSKAYTQKQHYERVKKMTPVVPYPMIPAVGDVVAHHVRTSANAGTGIKPKDWFCVPLNDSQHKHLHNHQTREERDERMVEAIAITANEVRKEFKRHFELETMSGYTEEMLLKHEEALGFHSGFVHGD
jgi:hypothetical protein